MHLLYLMKYCRVVRQVMRLHSWHLLLILMKILNWLFDLPCLRADIIITFPPPPPHQKLFLREMISRDNSTTFLQLTFSRNLLILNFYFYLLLDSETWQFLFSMQINVVSICFWHNVLSSTIILLNILSFSNNGKIFVWRTCCRAQSPAHVGSCAFIT